MYGYVPLKVKSCLFLAEKFPFNHVSGLTNLKVLEISRSKVTDVGVAYLKGIWY